MFTKEHYKAIAKIIKKHYEYCQLFTGTRALAAKDIAFDLADYFATDNPQFDRDKFLAACGL